jgi:hypothetical protein
MSIITDNDKKLPGYVPYPAGDDIYAKGEKEPYVEENGAPNPELTEEDKFDKVDSARRGQKSDDDDDEWNEQGYDENEMGGDLDVPGSDLDDDWESIGQEDEENNFYSISDNEEEDEDED